MEESSTQNVNWKIYLTNSSTKICCEPKSTLLLIFACVFEN